jgi:hypothetical protein
MSEFRLANPNSFQMERQSDVLVSALVADSTTNDVKSGEATVIQTVMRSPKDLDSMLVQDARSQYVQNIKQFLAKPHIIRSGRLNAGVTGGLAAIAVPEEPLAVPLFADKVDGFLGFRATTVFRLQFNANRFQQGRMIMYYIPQGQVNGACPGMRTSSLRRVTQLPNVQFDLSCDTEAILKIPYVAPTTHYNLIDGTGPIAALYLGVYSPLQYGTGISYADWTLWVHFEDVELVTPTIPFSDLPSFALRSNEDSGGGTEQDEEFVSQSGVSRYRRLMPTDTESSDSTSGPVESVLKDFSSLSLQASSIPLLSSVAAPANWVLSALEKTAAHFGWSNPLDESRVARVRNVIFPYLAPCDTVDSSLPLSLKANNKVEVLSGFAGTDIDESSIAYIVSVPSFHEQADWTTSNLHGDILFRYLLHPYTFCNTTTIGVTPNANVVTDHSPMSFISRFFRQWRGSIQFTFKIVKTSFHSGRLLFAFAPGYIGATGVSLDNTDYLHREIIDIREGFQFTFTAPYVSTHTWRSTETFTTEHAYGTVWLMVLNPLVCPDTVAQSVRILVEVSMTPDAQFAFPAPNLMIPYATDSEVFNFVSQSSVPAYTLPKDECRINSSDSLGNSKAVADQLTSAKYCVGEDIVSVLQLLKRTAITQLHLFTATQQTAFRPFTVGGVYYQSSVPSTVRSSWRGDIFSAICACFAYNRGGVRLAFVPSGSTFNGTRGDIYLAPTRTAAGVSQFSAANTANLVACACAPYDISRDGGQQVQVPQYNRLHSRLSRMAFEDPSTGLVEPRDLYSSEVSVVLTTGILSLPTIRRQVADDFSVGFFLGVPRTVSALAPT